MARRIIFLSLLLFLFGCAYLGYLKDPFVDIPNFYQVNGILYRGGQPSHDGLIQLKDKGIKTIISFCNEDEKSTLEKERIDAQGLGFTFFNLPLSMYRTPDDEQVLQFLDIVTGKNMQPVFIHCKSGRDRTGAMVALYRVVVGGWSIKEAYKEAKAFGFWPYRGECELKNFIHQLKDKKVYFERVKKKTPQRSL